MQLSMLPPALLALIPLVSAGYGYGSDSTYGSGSGSTSSSGSSAAVSSGSASSPATDVTIINVGKSGLTMDPSDVSVPAGQTIEFHFFTGSHSVAQSAFDSPCTPLNSTAGNGAEGFFSGPQAVQSGESQNVFRVVSTGSPMWYYCATGRHCQSGMVGVINKPANGQRTIQQYTAAAAKVAQNVSPSSVRGGSLAQQGTTPSGTGTGTGAVTTNTRVPGAGAGLLSGLSMPILGLAAAAAALVAM